MSSMIFSSLPSSVVRVFSVPDSFTQPFSDFFYLSEVEGTPPPGAVGAPE